METCNCTSPEEVRELKKKDQDHEKRIKELEIEMVKLKGDNQLSAYRHDEQMSVLKELQKDMKDLKEKSGRKWDDIVKAFMTAGIGGLVAYMGTKIFK